eukprot:161576-Amphidinium_carterae.2
MGNQAAAAGNYERDAAGQCELVLGQTVAAAGAAAAVVFTRFVGLPFFLCGLAGAGGAVAGGGGGGAGAGEGIDTGAAASSLQQACIKTSEQ